MSTDRQEVLKAFGSVQAKLEFNQNYAEIGWSDVHLVPITKAGLAIINQRIILLEGNIEELLRMYRDDSTSKAERDIIRSVGTQNRRFLRVAQEAKETIEIILSKEPFI